MKNEEFYEILEDSMKEPVFRKRSRGYGKEDDDHFQQKQRRSGKRSHRRPTHKDSFEEEYLGASAQAKKRVL